VPLVEDELLTLPEHLKVFAFFVPCCDVRYDLREKDIWFVFTPIYSCFINAFLYLFTPFAIQKLLNL